MFPAPRKEDLQVQALYTVQEFQVTHQCTIRDINYFSHFPYTLHFLIYNVLLQHTILLEIPLYYCTSNGLLANRFLF